MDWPAKIDGHDVRFVGIGRIVWSGKHRAAVELQHHEFSMQAKAQQSGSALDNDLPDEVPIASHKSIAGVACCGCIMARVDGSSVKLKCDECGAVVGLMQIDVLRELRLS